MDLEEIRNLLCEKLNDSTDEDVKKGLDALNEAVSEKKKTHIEFKRQQHTYLTILETVREIALKALDIPRFEQYTINTLRGHFGIMKVLFLRQEEYMDPNFGIHTPRMIDPPSILIPAESEFSLEIAKLGDRGETLNFDNPPEAIVNDKYLNQLLELGLKRAIPLIKKDEQGELTLHGLIGLGPRIGNLPFQKQDNEMLLLLGSMVGISLHNAHLYHRSIVDGLTRVYSRGHFDIHLEQEVARAKRFNENIAAGNEGKPTGVTLVMIDIDHFKKFNDKYGHQIGDSVLYEVAQILKTTVRKMDIVCRYGGEEFGVIFPDATYEVSSLISERLREAVDNLRIATDNFGDLSVTISLGVAVYPSDATELRELVAKSDASLYNAKDSGRNQTKLYCDIKEQLQMKQADNPEEKTE